MDFTDALYEAYKRDKSRVDTRIAQLSARNAALEQMVREAFELLDMYAYPGATAAVDWTERARALLEQEVKSGEG